MSLSLPHGATTVPASARKVRIGLRRGQQLHRLVVYALLLGLSMVFLLPFFIFLLRQFFMTIPRDLDDAARIDGASHLRILWDVILPLSRPALATVAIFAFIGNWTNLLVPLIYIRSTELYTLALGLNLFRGQNFTQFNMLMAVSIITLIPVLLVFFFAQRIFVRGVTLTGMGGR